ncbi:hypothetical protein PAAG_11167 [Paracoccidioides lutzii Pb01]|uniref:Uncharacterized protein n=1 Tax=Paracoccidioides lutzii (strain ATCC MYA-826 / Pb01) TaxID=502779 RepID=A0A0A2VMA8_PARBA|nr:hypothetical protein PAAG_11167 [Paracoccidioides lutzii Pb01]KGQ01994.1 hypothetical protein PAAG_11167 [Paracoccidioides lutzii Pb01]
MVKTSGWSLIYALWELDVRLASHIFVPQDDRPVLNSTTTTVNSKNRLILQIEDF